MTKLWWVRHLPVHLTGRYIGQSDVEAIIPSEPPTITQLLPAEAVWFASPLKRAQMTAQWLNAKEVRLAQELKEQHFGDWEDRYYDEVWKEAESLYDWSKPELIRPPQGESFADLCARVDGWLDRVLVENTQQQMVVVAHAGVIRAGIRHALHLSLAETLALQVEYASVTHIRYEQESATVKYANRLS